VKPRFPQDLFPDNLNIRLEHPLTGLSYTLLRADLLQPNAGLLAEVVAACNEPLIYDWLFRERCRGQPYAEADARSFFAWQQSGWQDGTFFVFLLLSPEGRVVGALDIKSSDLGAAEVGYWLSAAHRGLMNTALEQLEELARGAGFRSLYARVRPGNERSQAVVRRAGWQNTGLEDDGLHLRFVRSLL
jgi:RimJ/RimL family protein N-acetyltransferase